MWLRDTFKPQKTSVPCKCKYLGVGLLAVQVVERLDDLGQQIDPLLVDQEVEEVSGGGRELALLRDGLHDRDLLGLGHGGVGEELREVLGADSVEGVHVRVDGLERVSALGHLEESGRVRRGHLGVAGLHGYRCRSDRKNRKKKRGVAVAIARGVTNVSCVKSDECDKLSYGGAYGGASKKLAIRSFLVILGYISGNSGQSTGAEHRTRQQIGCAPLKW